MTDWRERLDKARGKARGKAPELRSQAEAAAARAREIATKGGRRGKAEIKSRLSERRAEAERRELWYETTVGPQHSESFVDDESMRRSIDAASAWGWSVVDIVEVQKRQLGAGLGGALAREALDRVRNSPRYVVTFRLDAQVLREE